jgi:hypothetical protein
VKTFIANFGRANYLWPACKALGTVATLEDEDLRSFWERGDRNGYIAHAIAHKKSAAGITPTRPVASRWFNLATIITETTGDVWIHREKDELWWTVTKPDPVQVTIELSRDLLYPGLKVFVLHKPAQGWSQMNKRGSRLVWKAIHPRAREFLFTEGTLQQLAEGNAAYAHALIEGSDLSPWHSQPAWKTKEEKSGKAPVTIFSAAKRTAFRMATTAMETATYSNGQEVARTIKNKEFRFDNLLELQVYLEAVLASQENLCAITSLPLQFDGEHSDAEMLCSLDRIDSNGHYEEGNLQVVCRFVNRWKSDSDDCEFRRLVRMLQTSATQI